MPGLCQRVAQGRDDEPPRDAGFAKADLGFRGVHVHIHARRLAVDEQRRRRVPERRLLWLAALGGTPGVFAAIHLFSHKTRKQPFRRWLFLILGVQIVGLGLLLAM